MTWGRSTERRINRYILIPIVVMLMTVIYLVAGLSELNIGVFAGDIGLLVTAVLFSQEIRKVMKAKESKELLRHESPINWLKASTEYFVFSLLSSLVYAFANVQDFGFTSNPIIEYLLFFCVIFFLMGLLYTVRIIWFIIDPASKANILTGKVLMTAKSISSKIVLFAFAAVLQTVNISLLLVILDSIFLNPVPLAPIAFVYLPTSILSIVATIPQLQIFLFRLKEKFRVRDLIISLCFYFPFILLIFYNLLLRFGIL